jgi:hypothetical protein
VKHLPANALRRQLGQAHSAGPHPDADQLTAFAEDALLDRERADVLGHLAVCESCRAIVHAASDAVEPKAAAVPSLQSARSPRRVWIRGIAVAASLVAIATSSILVYRATRTNPAGHPTIASAPAPAVPASQPLASAPAPPTVAPAEPRAKAPAPKRARTAMAPRTQAPPPPPSATETVTGSNTPVPLTTTQGDTSAYSLGSTSTRGAPSAQNQEEVQAQVMQQRSALAAAKVTPEAAHAEGHRIQDQRAFAGEFARSMHGAFMARPVERPRFRISDEGQIERSNEAGAWQPVAVGAAARFRVLSVAGPDIWAGGDHLRLFHSLDNGVTWLEVQLPGSADRTHAIAHIRIEPEHKLMVEADDGTAWRSIDGGVTWQ